MAPDRYQELRDAVRALCRDFDGVLAQTRCRARRIPRAFVDALTRAGWLSAMIPVAIRAARPRLAEASVIMEEINLLRRQRRRMSRADVQHGHAAAPRLDRAEAAIPAADRERRAAPAVDGGHRADDRHRHDRSSRPTAVRRGDRYVVNGQKVWISRVQHSDLMIVLARTTPFDRGQAQVRGNVRSSWSTCTTRVGARHDGAADRRTWSTTRPTSVFFDNLEIPAENLIGEEGKGFRYILDGLNAERTLIAAECIGDGYWFIDKARRYAKRARRVRPADRPEPGRAVSDRRGVHRSRRPRT